MTDLSSLSSDENFARILRPHPVEHDSVLSKIEGEIPRELAGTLYRNGPNQQIPPEAGNEALHLFDGDALINAIRFEDGRATVRGRYARTDAFVRQEEEGAYINAGLNLPADRPLETPLPGHHPNTNIVPHAGRLFALAENMPPFELDPETLDPKGLWDYDGKLLGLSTTAHPKIDGQTGQMWIHGYSPFPPFIQLYCVEADGTVSLAESHDAPWASMMHDFAITENHIIFPLGSMTFDVEPMLRGERFSASFRGAPDQPMLFGIRGREAGSEVRWFEAPSPGYMFHPGNAYEEGGKIFMDACTYESPQALLNSLDTARQGIEIDGFKAHPYLYEFDLAAETCKETKFSESTAEFPRIDDRLVGRKNRYGFAATAEPAEGSAGVFRRITRYDRQGGASVHQATVEGQWVGEPVFVPRTSDALEGEGFILNLRHDGVRDETAVDILDASAVDSPPLARVWLDQRAPVGFHGNWSPAT